MKFIRPMVYLLFAALIGGGFFLLDSKQAGSSNGAASPAPTAPIEANQMNAGFKIGGRITELLVKEGDTVKQGQVLARLQSAELEAKVAQAAAAVQLAQGKIAEAEGAAQTAQAKKQQGSAAVSLTAETADKQVAQAEAAVQAAQAKVDALTSGARPEEKKQADIQAKAAKEVYDIAAQNMTRMTNMLAQGLVSKADVDKTKVSFEEAKTKYELAQQQQSLVNQGPREEEIRGAQAQLDQAKAAVALAEANRAQVAVREGDVAAADASLRQAKGAVQSAQSGKRQAEAAQTEAEAYLSYAELIAPADGIVTALNAQTGELVGSGFPVFTLEATGTRWAKFYLNETDLSGWKTGDSVALKLNASGAAFTGKLIAVSPAADFAVKKATQTSGETDIRAFGVKVELQDPPEQAVTGMTVQWAGKTGAAKTTDTKGAVVNPDTDKAGPVNPEASKPASPAAAPGQSGEPVKAGEPNGQ